MGQGRKLRGCLIRPTPNRQRVGSELRRCWIKSRRARENRCRENPSLPCRAGRRCHEESFYPHFLTDLSLQFLFEETGERRSRARSANRQVVVDGRISKDHDGLRQEWYVHNHVGWSDYERNIPVA